MVFAKNGISYDFGVLRDGIFFDDFGHGVLPEDADISHRAKTKSEYRILFLGGSTTFQPWPFLVAEILSGETSLNVRAISAGTGGYTSQENVIDLITSGFSYDPDMVIAYLPINDILHAARWPSFRRDYSHFRTALTAEVKEPDTPEPENHILIYPFMLRLIQTAKFNSDMRDYIAKLDLQEFTTVRPHPDQLGIWIDENSYEGTVQAVIDNIYDMKVLAHARGIPFILFTQKLFATEEPFDKYVRPKILKAIEALVNSAKLSDIPKIQMQNIFPDTIDGSMPSSIKKRFPEKPLNVDEPLSYDSMHFSPLGLHMFGILAADSIRPWIGQHKKRTG